MMPQVYVQITVGSDIQRTTTCDRHTASCDTPASVHIICRSASARPASRS